MDLVTVKTFDNPIDAHLLRIHLESEGIPCYIFDEEIVSIQPLFANAVGGIKVKIHREHIDTVRTLLENS
jgi:hypothetical protein